LTAPNGHPATDAIAEGGIQAPGSGCRCGPWRCTIYWLITWVTPPSPEQMDDTLARLKVALEARYDVADELGEGGMARVYLAKDLKHHRQVAIKVLRPEIAVSLGRSRFLREIEIAANLNHPHILALFDSGDADGFLYYVMPLVEGETLQDRLDQEGELPIAEVVRVLQDVVDALAYAHDKGVIHRDIKPSNVMLAGRHAVVTDFGIAKAVWEASTTTAATRVGTALGTPAYMAPEQATGEPVVDHRADIYSIGVLAYHLLTGRGPFEGSTAAARMAAQLTKEPAPVSSYRPNVPGELELLVMRCLERRPADRWQSAHEMLLRLQALEPGAERLPTMADDATRRRRLIPVLVGVGGMAVLVAVFGPGLIRNEQVGITTGAMVQVTNAPGLEFQPALSPDGKEVAYVGGSLARPHVAIRSSSRVDGGEIRVGIAADELPLYPTWNWDGESLRIETCETPLRRVCAWHQVGRMGGSIGAPTVPTVSFPEASGRPLVWSRDGTQGAIVRGDSIFTFSGDRPDPELLARGPSSVPHSLSWSPDGRWIAFVNGNPQWRTSGNQAGAAIWMVDVSDGTLVRIVDESSMNVSPQWLPDSRHLLFVSDRAGARGIYVVEVGASGARGEPYSVLSASDAHSISISNDGSKLAYAKFSVTQNIWAMPYRGRDVGSLRRARRVTTGNQVIETHGLSADGRWLAFDSNRRGVGMDIFRVPVEGGVPELVVDLPDPVYDPAWSPDGGEIAFYTVAPDDAAVRVMVATVGGGQPAQAAAGSQRFNGAPEWSPDGKSILFQAFGKEEGASQRAWTVSRAAVGEPWGEPVGLKTECWFPKWSPSGDSVLCVINAPESRIALVGRDGIVLDTLDTLDGGVARPTAKWRPSFSLDGSQIYFIGRDSEGAEGVWSLPVGGGRPTKLIAFDDSLVDVSPHLTVGPDEIFLTVTEYESDIWIADLVF